MTRDFRPSPSPRDLPCRSYSPSGFLTLALCCLLLGLYQVALREHPGVVAAGFLYGGLAQAITGIHEWRRGNAFGAAAFTACGLFWLSLLPVLVLPAAGVGLPYQPFAAVPYLTLWSLFAALLGHGAAQEQRLTGFIFGALALLLGLAAAAMIWENPAIRQVACLVGIGSALLACYQGLMLLSLRIARGRQPAGAAVSKPS